MRNTIARIIAAIRNAITGTWKAMVKGGKVFMEWVREEALPEILETAHLAFDASVDVAKSVLTAVPNTLARLTGRGAAFTPAPAPTDAAAPLDVQRQGRQDIIDAANNADRKRGLAISVRAGARALLRDQTPVGVPEPVVAWMRSLGAEKLSILAGMPPDRIEEALAGKPTALGAGYQAAVCEDTTGPVQTAPAPRPPEPVTPVSDIRQHIERRNQERLQRMLKGMGPPLPGEALEPRAVRP